MTPVKIRDRLQENDKGLQEKQKLVDPFFVLKIVESTDVVCN